MDLEKPEITTLEYPEHYTLVHDMGESLLVVLADRNRATLGRLRYEIKSMHIKYLTFSNSPQGWGKLVWVV